MSGSPSKLVSSIATMAKVAEASEFSIWVRRPAARELTSRSQPITPPRMSADSSRSVALATDMDCIGSVKSCRKSIRSSL